jgi:hypothetical protein
MKVIVAAVFFTIINFQSNINAQSCEVTMTLYRANMKPVASQLVTFKSDDENHQVEVITKKDGFCKVMLNQNTHYNILFQDIFYTEMFKIPKTQFLECNGPMLIDGGLYTILNLEVFDNQGNYSPLKNETIFCESLKNGEIYEQKTNNSGVVEFYLPRNASYNFHSFYEKNIQSIDVSNARGVAVFTISIKANTTPENQYYQRIMEAEKEAIQSEKQLKIEDSLIGTIPINVLLFLNVEPQNEDDKCTYLGDVFIYDKPSKNNLIGIVKGNWNLKGLCENGISLCMNSVTNKDGSFSKAVLPVKLTRGTHQFYVENKNGDFKKSVQVEVKSYKSYLFLTNQQHKYSITAPMCVTN